MWLIPDRRIERVLAEAEVGGHGESRVRRARPSGALASRIARTGRGGLRGRCGTLWYGARANSARSPPRRVPTRPLLEPPARPCADELRESSGSPLKAISSCWQLRSPPSPRLRATRPPRRSIGRRMIPPALPFSLNMGGPGRPVPPSWSWPRATRSTPAGSRPSAIRSRAVSPRCSGSSEGPTAGSGSDHGRSATISPAGPLRLSRRRARRGLHLGSSECEITALPFLTRPPTAAGARATLRPVRENNTDSAAVERAAAKFPFWLNEGMPDYLAQRAAATTGFVEGDVFAIGGLARADSVCAARLRASDRRDEIRERIGRTGRLAALFTTDRALVAPVTTPAPSRSPSMSWRGPAFRRSSPCSRGFLRGHGGRLSSPPRESRSRSCAGHGSSRSAESRRDSRRPLPVASAPRPRPLGAPARRPPPGALAISRLQRITDPCGHGPVVQGPIAQARRPL